MTAETKTVLAGVVEALAIVLFMSVTDRMLIDDTRSALMLASIVPAGSISGFLTALIVSAVTSPVKHEQHSYAVLGLQQNKADETAVDRSVARGRGGPTQCA